MPLPEAEGYILLNPHIDKQAAYNVGKMIENYAKKKNTV